MSLIKSIRKQLGLSVTPANNFTLTAEADDGTMKIARGNAGATTQDILTVDAAGKVAFPQNVQTWQNVGGSRALNGTTYTNTTGVPIKVSVSGSPSTTSFLVATVAGVIMYGPQASAAGFRNFIYFEVPAGATYSVAPNSGTATIETWTELR